MQVLRKASHILRGVKFSLGLSESIITLSVCFHDVLKRTHSAYQAPKCLVMTKSRNMKNQVF